MGCLELWSVAQGVVGGAKGKGGMSCVLKDVPEGWFSLALDYPSLDSGDKFTSQVTLVRVFCYTAPKSIQTDKATCAVSIFILSDTGNQSLESISQVTELAIELTRPMTVSLISLFYFTAIKTECNGEEKAGQQDRKETSLENCYIFLLGFELLGICLGAPSHTHTHTAVILITSSHFLKASPKPRVLSPLPFAHFA